MSDSETPWAVTGDLAARFEHSVLHSILIIMALGFPKRRTSGRSPTFLESCYPFGMFCFWICCSCGGATGLFAGGNQPAVKSESVARLETRLAELAESRDVPSMIQFAERAMRDDGTQNLAAAAVHLAQRAMDLAQESPEKAALWAQAAVDVCSLPAIRLDATDRSTEMGRIIFGMSQRLREVSPIRAARLRSSVRRSGNDLMLAAFEAASGDAEVFATATHSADEPAEQTETTASPAETTARAAGS